MTNREAYDNMWDELEQYRAIGTVEECREAVERQKCETRKDKQKKDIEIVKRIERTEKR